MITITDTTSNTTVTATDWTEIPAAVAPLFPEAPQEITDAINDLAQAVNAGAYLGDLEAFLGLSVTL